MLVSQSIKREIRYKGSLGIPFSLSKKILEKRHRLIPGLKKWWRGLEQQVKHTRVITTCLGRKRLFFGRLDHSTFRTATAFEPQSTVGDVANIIFRRLDYHLPKDCHLVLQVHDEVDIEFPTEKLHEIVKLVREAAQVPLYLCKGRPPLIIPIDIETGPSWGEVKEYKDA